MAGRGKLLPVAEANGRSAEDTGRLLRPSERYQVTDVERDEMAAILHKASLRQGTDSSKKGPSVGVGNALKGVMSDLLELFGESGPYGLLFKLAAFIESRLEAMQDVEERAQQVAAHAEFIWKSFEKVEIQFTLTDVSILQQATETLCFCAMVLQRLSASTSGACACLLTRICKFLSASANLAQLIDEVLAFLGKTNSDQGAVSCVVSFCGVKGVGKTRLMFEVQKRFPAKSITDRFYTMNFALASDPMSRLYLQQGLVEYLESRRTATALRSADSGMASIRRCLDFVKRSGRRVLFAFDNVGKADDLTSILPLNLCEELPPGSCILVSLANNNQILRAIKQVFPESLRCQHKDHWVPPLKQEDAKVVFSLYADSRRPKDEWMVDKVVSLCEGLPLLLKAVGQAGWADWQAGLDALTKAENVAQKTKLIGEIIEPISLGTDLPSISSGPTEDVVQTMDADASSLTIDPIFLETDSPSSGSRMDMDDRRLRMEALNKRLDSKLKVVFGALDEELQNALDDIRSSLFGWDWRTVEAILGAELDHGKDLMHRLADRSLISNEVTKGASLAPVANLTRYSGPGPWKTNVVAVQDHVPQPSNTVTTSMVELDHPEAVTPDRIQGVKYLVLHNSKLDRTCFHHLADLKFLYWSVSSHDASTSFTFPFQGRDVLPQLKLLIISGNLDVHHFTIPSELPRLILLNCSATRELPEAVFASRKLEELRLRDCPNLARLSLPQRNRHLETLCLERCSALQTLPKALAGLKALQTLELLSCDGLDELEAGALGSLDTLRALSVIGCNRLAALPHNLKKLSNLESLNLSFCSNLGEVLQIGEGLGKLEVLDLTGCSSIRQLSPDTKMLTSLMKLNLVACSNLVSLPDEIGELQNLQELAMGFCIRARNLPASVINLVSLRKLLLTGCSTLQGLPKGLDGLRNLKFLSLLGCRALDASNHANVNRKLRDNNAVVHAQPADLRTAYTSQQPTARVRRSRVVHSAAYKAAIRQGVPLLRSAVPDEEPDQRYLMRKAASEESTVVSTDEPVVSSFDDRMRERYLMRKAASEDSRARFVIRRPDVNERRYLRTALSSRLMSPFFIRPD